jgi:site-specific DNA recombinase
MGKHARDTTGSAARRVGIYTRISDDREGRGAGVARQEKSCRDYAKARGWVVVETYTDNDLAASRATDRPAHTRLMGDLRSGRIDTVVVWAIDRLYRRPVELEELLDLFDEQTDLLIEAVEGAELRLNTTDGRLMARLMVSLAKAETDRLGDRVRAKHLEMAQSGLPHGGPRSFGFAPDKLSLNEAEAEVLRQAADYFIATDGNATATMRFLNERGFTTTTGKPWYSKALKNALTAPRVAGLREHKGQIYAAKWPAILDRDTWEKVCRLYANPARRTSTGNRPRNLLASLMFCAECGTRMRTASRGRDNESQRAYACRSEAGYLLSGCGKNSTLIRWTDAFVTEVVLARLEADKRLLREVAQSGEGTPRARKRSQLLGDEERINTRRAEALEMLAVGELTRADYARLTQRMDDQMREVEKELNKLDASEPLRLMAGAGSIREAWETRSLSEQSALIRVLIERIDVSRAPHKGSIKEAAKAKRLHIVWREEL